jgi:hypothetical protein
MNLADLPEFFRRRIDATGDHWLWTGAMDREYGRVMRWKRPTEQAHRAVWRQLVGEIEDGHDLHHRETCPKNCVDPTHLTSLPSAEHTAHHHTRTHCKRGHDMSDAYSSVVDGRLKRLCRTCHLERQARYRAKKTS